MPKKYAKPYKSKLVTATADDGTAVTIGVPAEPVTDEQRGDLLRKLYETHVKPLSKYGWKGPCEAVVPENLAADVADAMSFMGSLVDDEQTLPGGKVRLFSEGYWAHGF